MIFAMTAVALVFVMGVAHHVATVRGMRAEVTRRQRRHDEERADLRRAREQAEFRSAIAEDVMRCVWRGEFDAIRSLMTTGDPLHIVEFDRDGSVLQYFRYGQSHGVSSLPAADRRAS